MAERGHEEFFAQLAQSDDGFDVVSDYFGRNIFSNTIVLGGDSGGGNGGANNAASSATSDTERRAQLFA